MHANVENSAIKKNTEQLYKQRFLKVSMLFAFQTWLFLLLKNLLITSIFRFFLILTIEKLNDVIIDARSVTGKHLC